MIAFFFYEHMESCELADISSGGLSGAGKIGTSGTLQLIAHCRYSNRLCRHCRFNCRWNVLNIWDRPCRCCADEWWDVHKLLGQFPILTNQIMHEFVCHGFYTYDVCPHELNSKYNTRTQGRNWHVALLSVARAVSRSLFSDWLKWLINIIILLIPFVQVIMWISPYLIPPQSA